MTMMMRFSMYHLIEAAETVALFSDIRLRNRRVILNEVHRCIQLRYKIDRHFHLALPCRSTKRQIRDGFAQGLRTMVNSQR